VKGKQRISLALGFLDKLYHHFGHWENEFAQTILYAEYSVESTNLKNINAFWPPLSLLTLVAAEAIRAVRKRLKFHRNPLEVLKQSGEQFGIKEK
jgi:hypothetical protein